MSLAISVLPVLVLLAGLIYFDSYQLVPMRRIVLAIGVGVLVAGGTYALNLWLMEELDLDFGTYTRYIAPVLEEFLKAVYPVSLVRRRRIGFLVDGAILGFAVGAGFAVVENISYVSTVSTDNHLVWVIRGFGTAIMHGGMTAMFVVTYKSLSEQRSSRALHLLLPGFGIAAGMHSFFNHFFLSPVLTTVLVVLTVPALMVAIFRSSENATQEWLGIGFDTDTDLLTMIMTGNIAATRVGTYLGSLQERMRGEIVVDMLCYMRIFLELSIQAKGILIMREAGFEIPPDPDVKSKFEELRFLERSIGKTGKLALGPLLRVNDRDLWQL
ncbi:MAG: PrsW family glutamic-type intramembrane protease, partial [Bacteroidota bacterium]